MLSSQTTCLHEGVLKLRSIEESSYNSLRNDEKRNDERTENQLIGIATVMFPVNGARTQHSPAPNKPLEGPRSLVALFGLKPTESTPTRGTMSLLVGLKGSPCREGYLIVSC